MSGRITARTLAALLVVSALIPSAALAKRNNPAAGVNGSTASGGVTCAACHAGPAGSGSVQIMGAPSTYQADAVYALVVRVSDPVQAGAGFQLSVEDASGVHVGTILVTDPTNTKLNDSDPNWVNHTGTGVGNSVSNWAFNGNAADFAVSWQAPSGDVGPVTFFAAGNAIDNSNGLTGDLVYVTNHTATFASIPAVSQWGLAVLGLGTVAAATVTIARRRPVVL